MEQEEVKKKKKKKWPEQTENNKKKGKKGAKDERINSNEKNKEEEISGRKKKVKKHTQSTSVQVLVKVGGETQLGTLFLFADWLSTDNDVIFGQRRGSKSSCAA